jgi:membrane carboxypeptidase/penicillin-binding protein
MLVLAVITGSLAGLTLVYSVDLPQINDLERYRPSTTTDLYDRKGRIIGSFALERREVVNYDDFAPVLRQAVISIEDKSFESHWGINVLRVAGAPGTTALPRPRPGRFHADHAAGAQPLSLLRAHRRPQSAGSLSRHPD